MAILAEISTFWKVFGSTLFLLTCVLLIVVVLLQRGRGGGLSGAFGGAGGGYSPFGAKTGDFFTWLTVGLAGLFLVLAIMTNYLFQKVEVQTQPPKQQPLQVPAGAPQQGAQPAGGAVPGPAPAGQVPPAPDGPTPVPVGEPPSEKPAASPKDSPGSS